MTRWLGVEPDSRLSPRMMQKAIHAAVASRGFDEASASLRVLAEGAVSPCRLRRLTERIGNERIAQVDRQTAAYELLALPKQQQCPVGMAPDVACVQCDGGRIQIRDRAAGTAEGSGAAGSGAGERASYWRETKAATLLKMKSRTHAEDPCPAIPEIFVNAARMQRLSREIKGFSATPGESETPPPAVDASLAAAPQTLLGNDELHVSTRPEIILRSVLASTRDIHEFGRQLTAVAHARGFHAADRKAFVADGMPCNWNLHQKHFARYTPIVDFVHVLCYVYGAAMAGQNTVIAWTEYCQWAQWLWSGQTGLLLAALAERQQTLGSPAADESESSPRSKIATALTYLKNQSSRMNYPEYRQQGLPITSAHIESTIKQLNQRVKGTEKFWSINADPVLQLRADYLSETEALQKFWQTRCQQLSSSTRYHSAA